MELTGTGGGEGLTRTVEQTGDVDTTGGGSSSDIVKPQKKRYNTWGALPFSNKLRRGKSLYDVCIYLIIRGCQFT